MRIIPCAVRPTPRCTRCRRSSGRTSPCRGTSAPSLWAPKKLMLRTLRDRRGQDKEAGPWRRAPEQMPARTPLQHHVLSTTPWIISGWASCRASRGASASTLACWFSARLEPIDLGPFRGLREGLQVRRRPVVLHHLLHLSLIIIFFGMYYLCNK